MISSLTFSRRSTKRVIVYGFLTLLAVFLLQATAMDLRQYLTGTHITSNFQKIYGHQAYSRVVALKKLMQRYQGASIIEKLNGVNRFFNQAQFMSDDQLWNKHDYWATPLQFIGVNAGDCEDFSVAKYFALRALGVPDHKLFLVYVNALDRNNAAHMVLAYYPTPDADPLILDNIKSNVLRGSQRYDLKPVYSFNGQGLWLKEHPRKNRLIGGAMDINMWSSMIKRMANEYKR